jgi:hypothetical protein
MAISDDTELKFYNFINATNKATAIICCLLAIRPFFHQSLPFLLLSKLKQCIGLCSSTHSRILKKGKFDELGPLPSSSEMTG